MKQDISMFQRDVSEETHGGRDSALALPNKPYVKLEHLYKSYGAHTVLTDVSLSVPAGDVSTARTSVSFASNS